LDLDKLFSDYFDVLLSKIVIAEKVNTIMNTEMDNISDEIIYNPTEGISEKFKQCIVTYKKITNDINDTLLNIYKFSEDNNYFWKDCSVEVYNLNYKIIRDNYIEKYTYTNEIDFIKYEYQCLLDEDDKENNIGHFGAYNKDFFSLLNYQKFMNNDNKQFFSLLKVRKMEFLKSQIDRIGGNLEILVIGGKQKVNIYETKVPKVDDLTLSGLPKFNLQQRYEIFKKLGFEDTIHKLKTDKQMSKNKILAIVLGVNPDNAKQLLNGTYKGLSSKDENLLIEFLVSQEIKIS
jgi:hypothetical protein